VFISYHVFLFFNSFKIDFVSPCFNFSMAIEDLCLIHNSSKPERFDGTNFKGGNVECFIGLTSLKLACILTESLPSLGQHELARSCDIEIHKENFHKAIVHEMSQKSMPLVEKIKVAAFINTPSFERIWFIPQK